VTCEAATGPPADQGSRARAAGTLDRSFMVEAGAGTGKTRLIVERTLRLLESGTATFDQLAVITFTEKAAGELKVRLRQEVERRLRERSGDPARLQDALDGIDRAAVCTIHAFAASLLRERPVEAGIDPRFRVLDDLQSEMLREEVFDAFWLDSLAREDPDLGEALGLGLSSKRVRALAHLAAEARDLAPPPPPETVDAPGSFVRDFLAGVAVLDGLARHCVDPDDDALETIRHLRSLAESVRGLDPEEGWLRVLMEGKVKRTAGNQGHWEPAASLREVKNRFSVLEEARLGAIDRLGGRVAHRLGLWLVRLNRAYSRALQERGAIDFQGLLLRARDLLRDHAEARLDLRRRYRFLLVDEFQDTDPLQAEIVLSLAADPSDGARQPATPGPGRLFVVGDPKQSIYRFRRADIAVYEAVGRVIEKSPTGSRERITVNFRTVPGLIQWVNQVFPCLIKPGEGEGHGIDYAPILPHRAPLREGAAVAVLPLPPGAVERASTADGARAVEAALVASLVGRIGGGAEWPVQDRSGGKRPAAWRDVTLLFRALTGVEAFEEAFRARGIPYRIVGGRGFYTREETRQLKALLRAVDDPHDALSVAAALRSPFLGCSDEDLLLYTAGPAAGRFDYLRDAGRLPPGDAVGDALRFLRGLHLRRDDLPTSATVEEILDRTGILALLFMKPQGEQRVANLLKVADLARRHELAGAGGFRSFVRFLSSMEEEERQETESPTVDESDDVVRLMTIHQAKGLEFPIVVLADASAQPGQGDGWLLDRSRGVFHFKMSLADGDLRAASHGYLDLEAREKEFEAEEQARLLYVAVTRARDHLVLPVVPHGGRFQSLLGLLRQAGAVPEAPADLVTGSGPFARLIDTSALEITTREAPPFRFEPRAIEGEIAADAARLAERARWKEELASALMKASRGRPVAAASAWEGGGPAGRPGAAPEDAPPDDDARPAHEARSRRRRVGIAVHAVLERLPPRPPGADRRVLASLASAAAWDAGLDPMDAKDVANLAAAAFSSSLPARLARARRFECEFPFLWRADAAGQQEGVLEGRIDLLVEEPGGHLIVDYKTDRPPAGKPVGRFLEERQEVYRPQAAVYAAAMTSLGLRVTSVLLVFLAAGREVELRADADLLALGRRALVIPPARAG
jgi:ATP-dependent helicase/nuclease subunit A